MAIAFLHRANTPYPANSDLEIFDDEIADLETKLSGMTMAYAYAVSCSSVSAPTGMFADPGDLFQIARELWAMHRYDQNFPQEALNKIEDFVKGYDGFAANPNSDPKLIREVKIECLLATENSPYLEVRANTDTTDDPTMPCLTLRAMFIGTIFATAGSFIDTLFAFRQPAIYVGVNVGQLLACKSRALFDGGPGLKGPIDPFGKFLAKVTPNVSFRMFGREIHLNPGPFNKKEHMLITL